MFECTVCFQACFSTSKTPSSPFFHPLEKIAGTLVYPSVCVLQISNVLCLPLFTTISMLEKNANFEISSFMLLLFPFSCCSEVLGFLNILKVLCELYWNLELFGFPACLYPVDKAKY